MTKLHKAAVLALLAIAAAPAPALAEIHNPSVKPHPKAKMLPVPIMAARLLPRTKR